jgi:glycosyltransferase involved in cell wall biosynthesis
MRLLYVGDLRSIHLQRWLRYFAAQGHDVHVVTPKGGAAPPGVRVRAQLHVRAHAPILSYAANAAVLLPRTLWFAHLVRQVQPDIIHVHYLNDAGFTAALAGVRPLILTAWGSDVVINPKQSRLLRAMVAFMLRRADLVTCDADHVRRALVELGAQPGKVALVYFGTDTEKFHPGKRDPGLRASLGIDRGPSIISIRTLDPLYDVSTLLRAFPDVHARYPSSTLVIGGIGPDAARLGQMAHDLGIASAVRFVGWIPEDELARYLASCDVYVSTALSDGGIAASTAEAMACGVPVVVTDVGDNRDWVSDGINGFVVPARDPSALAAKIIPLLDDKAERLRLGQNGRALIEQKDNWVVEMSKMAAYYRQLAAAGLPETAGPTPLD